MLTVITRNVSPNLGDCALTYLERNPIDVEKAVEQHRNFVNTLTELGARVINLPAEPNLPDAVFVEDTAVVVDEVAVIARMGLPERRPEAESVASALAHLRRRKFVNRSATLDGGDAIRIDRRLYIGNSTRTGEEGIAELRRILKPYDYDVRPVKVIGCLHLSTGCSYLGRNTILANEKWVDAGAMKKFEIIHVPEAEPWAANTICINDVVLLPSAFPRTRELLESRGFKIRIIDISEFQKAEGGLSCLSLVFRDKNGER